VIEGADTSDDDCSCAGRDEGRDGARAEEEVNGAVRSTALRRLDVDLI
jgi:hypothetical protein